MEREYFFEKFIKQIGPSLGSSVRIELSQKIARAKKIIIEEEFKEKIEKLSTTNINEVEKNLDKIFTDKNEEDIWIEWNDTKQNQINGILTTRNPENKDEIIIFYSSMDDTIKFSHYVAVLNNDKIKLNAWGARNIYTNTQNDSFLRILDQTAISAPLSLKEEMENIIEIEHKYDDRLKNNDIKEIKANTEHKIKMILLEKIPQILSVLVIFECKNIVTEELGKNKIKLMRIQKNWIQKINRICSKKILKRTNNAIAFRF